MRRFLSIAKATALEILSEPLSLLLLLAALVLSTVAPVLHYHQFGEASRMARDAGFSALLTCGLLVAVFGTVKSFRREVESGTMQMALAHPVSRTGFLLAKAFGATLAYLVFAAIVAANALTVVNGAEIGGRLAAARGDIPRIYGVSVALSMGTLLLPLILGAALNRIARFRFVPTAFALAFVCAAIGVCPRFDLSLAARMLPVTVASILPVPLFIAAAAAFSVRFRANGVAAALTVLFALTVPIVGNYHLPDALSRGGTLPWGYVGFAALAMLPAVAAFLLLGSYLIGARDADGANGNP